LDLQSSLSMALDPSGFGAHLLLVILSSNLLTAFQMYANESYVYDNLAAPTEKTGLERELDNQRLNIPRNSGLTSTRANDVNVLHRVISTQGRQALTPGGENTA